MRSTNHLAFTLIEVLVTLAISSMILLMGTLSMKFMVTSLSKNTSTLPLDGIIYTQIRSVVASTFPYVVYSKKTFEPNRYDYHLFYEGDDKKVLFITESPLFTSRPSIVELSLVNKQLIYKESLLYDPSADYLTPAIATGTHTLILMDNLDDAAWSYETNQTSSTKISGEIPKRLKLTYARNKIRMNYTFEIQTNYDQNIIHVRKHLENV